MENLLNQLCNKYPEFLESLNSFQEDIKQKIVRRLKNETNETTFTSTLTEIDFGQLFNNLGFDLEYEKPYYTKQTPDWILSVGDSKAICEVYRLGKSKNDQFTYNFLSQLTKKVRELKYRYIVRLKILNTDFDTSKEKIVSIVQNLENWLLSSLKNIGEKLIIEDSLEFTITRINTNSNHLICYSYRSIDIKLNKIIQFKDQDKNKITCKLSKYNEIIREYNYPYFIAIALDFASGFDFEDFKEYFLGGAEFDCEDDSDYETLLEDRDYGTEWTELGVFYKNPLLSGLIILDNSKFNLLLNPLKSQAIYKDDNLLILNNLKKI
ncbi:MAG: hypothetical protein Q8904_05855 [Bacteroidota bacterium]|nr:hypothetical protein [Bacteroidota bacterium]